jgi:hypothetical protein
MIRVTEDDWTEDAAQRLIVRLKQMDDESLARFLRAAEFMALPQSNWNGRPRQMFIQHLRLAREETARRRANGRT